MQRCYHNVCFVSLIVALYAEKNTACPLGVNQAELKIDYWNVRWFCEQFLLFQLC